jgi:hypothetical protein
MIISPNYENVMCTHFDNASAIVRHSVKDFVSLLKVGTILRHRGIIKMVAVTCNDAIIEFVW